MSPTGKDITLSIERLAGLGEGCGEWEGKKTFVPYTLPGEQVRAVVTQATQDFLRARPLEILTPSEDRVPAPCAHFSVCGGCSLQHLSARAYTDFKQKTLAEALRKAGCAHTPQEPLMFIAPASRRRVDFSVHAQNGEVELGFLKARSHEIVPIGECHVLLPPLQQLIHPLRAALKTLRLAAHIESVQALYLHPLLDIGIVPRTQDASQEKALVALGNALGAARISVLHAQGPKVLMQKRPVQRAVDAMQIELPPFCFLQASEAAEARMIGEVTRGLHQCRAIADLFCGVGTYSIPLTLHAHVQAYDAVSGMTDAVNQAAHQNDLQRQLQAFARDLLKHPLTFQELSAFDGAVINPPRDGAKAQCEQLAQSSLKKLVMVSCNPASFARDARILTEGGFRLQHAVGIDQFVYSPHLEIVAQFVKE
jgi:23S rRNA (uracil1939-C5)-methyltransferase